MKKYKLKYRIDFEHGEFTKDQIGDHGGTDALFIASILREGEGVHDGWKSIGFFSVDGSDPNARGIPETEMFQVFSHLAHHLKNSESIPQWQKNIAETTFESVKTKVVRNK